MAACWVCASAPEDTHCRGQCCGGVLTKTAYNKHHPSPGTTTVLRPPPSWPTNTAPLDRCPPATPHPLASPPPCRSSDEPGNREGPGTGPAPSPAAIVGLSNSLGPPPSKPARSRPLETSSSETKSAVVEPDDGPPKPPSAIIGAPGPPGLPPAPDPPRPASGSPGAATNSASPTAAGDESGCRTDESDRDDPDTPELCHPELGEAPAADTNPESAESTRTDGPTSDPCAPERDRSPCPPDTTSVPATGPPSNDCGAGICWRGWGAASSRSPPLAPDRPVLSPADPDGAGAFA
jgi:hypothetical protein